MQVVLMRVIALDLGLELDQFVEFQLVLLLEAPSALLFLEGVLRVHRLLPIYLLVIVI